MKTIGWVMPNFETEGSGGLKTLFDFVNCLSGLYEQDIYVSRTEKVKTDAEAKAIINKYFGEMPGVSIYCGHDKIKDDYYDLLMATWCMTAFKVNKISAREKAYFVQDLEYMFFPMSDWYLWAQESYTYGFKSITMGRWIAKELKKLYNIDSNSIDFCADLSVYKPLNLEREKAVCFLFQPEKHRRCWEMGLKALRYAKDRIPDLKVYTYGSLEGRDIIKEKYPDFKYLGLLDIKMCNYLYNMCQLGMCFSPTNPSRIPFEMYAAGLPVLDFNLDNNKYDFGDDYRPFVPESNTYDSLGAKICELVQKPENLELAGADVYRFMRTRKYDLGFEQFRTAVKELIGV
jgi:glycosyltransferase involved in cell wall biosynthesis